MRWIKKTDGTFLMAARNSITVHSLGKMNAGCRRENKLFVTGGIPPTGKLPVLNIIN